MRINWQCTADIHKLALKRDDETGERTVTVTIVALLDENESTAVFGEEFRKLVFDARNGSQQVACAQWKPIAVFEAHVCSFAGAKAVQTVPVFDKVEPAGAGHVRVFVKLPFVLDDRRLTVALVESFGDGIALDVQPQNGSLLETEKPATQTGRGSREDLQ